MNNSTAILSTETPEAPQIGSPIEGGFYAGTINLNGQHYGIVVAPKATGETKGQWGEYSKEIPATHIADGFANTAVMFVAGSEIAQWAQKLNINGHSDWYIPSRDELELIYRNLKPSTRKNLCGFKDGESISSHPIGTPYSPDAPAQTVITDFQEGNAEAMEEAWYWSSTQYSAHGAFIQDFEDGYQLYYGKGSECRVRAVRRFLIN